MSIPELFYTIIICMSGICLNKTLQDYFLVGFASQLRCAVIGICCSFFSRFAYDTYQTLFTSTARDIRIKSCENNTLTNMFIVFVFWTLTEVLPTIFVFNFLNEILLRKMNINVANHMIERLVKNNLNDEINSSIPEPDSFIITDTVD